MTGFKNGGEKGFKDFLATHYHKPNDDLNQPINYQAGARFALVNYEIARELADAPARPGLEQGRLLREPVREEVVRGTPVRGSHAPPPALRVRRKRRLLLRGGGGEPTEGASARHPPHPS